MALSFSCLRRSNTSSDKTCSDDASATLSLPIVRFDVSACADPVAIRTKVAIRKTAPKTNPAINIPQLLRSAYFHRSFEQGTRKENTCHPQALQKLRTNPTWLERSDDLAIGPSPFPYETEDLLHTDDVLVHSSDLRNTHHFSRAIAQTR